jgi:hypothetical protein
MTKPIPDFDSEGLLPPGDYQATISELKQSILVIGPLSNDGLSNWDLSWRLWHVEQLEVLVNQLWHVGIADVFVDGSFAEDKEHPNDIDGYFVCDITTLASGELQRLLNLLDPQKVWTWDPASRRPHPGSPKAQLPMWHVYRVELYPHVAGLGCGILDEHGNELEFPAAFRRSRRNGQQRGIIKLTQG